MSESLVDEEFFFRLIHSMPDYTTAIDMCLRAKTVMLERTVCKKNSITISRLNNEIGYLRQKREDASIKKAIIFLYGESGWEQVKAKVMELKREGIMEQRDGQTTNSRKSA